MFQKIWLVRYLEVIEHYLLYRRVLNSPVRRRWKSRSASPTILKRKAAVSKWLGDVDSPGVVVPDFLAILIVLGRAQLWVRRRSKSIFLPYPGLIIASIFGAAWEFPSLSWMSLAKTIKFHFFVILWSPLWKGTTRLKLSWPFLLIILWNRFFAWRTLLTRIQSLPLVRSNKGKFIYCMILAVFGST